MASEVGESPLWGDTLWGGVWVLDPALRFWVSAISVVIPRTCDFSLRGWTSGILLATLGGFCLFLFLSLWLATKGLISLRPSSPNHLTTFWKKTYVLCRPCLPVHCMALSEKGKSDRRLHYLITGCPFRSQLCETQKNKGETFEQAVAGTMWKKLDWGHGDPCDFDPTLLLWMSQKWNGKCVAGVLSLCPHGLWRPLLLHHCVLPGYQERTPSQCRPVPADCSHPGWGWSQRSHVLLTFRGPYHTWTSNMFCVWMGITHGFGQQKHWNLIHWATRECS